MEAKIQYKNERNRVRSAKILEDVFDTEACRTFYTKTICTPLSFDWSWYLLFYFFDNIHSYMDCLFIHRYQVMMAFRQCFTQCFNNAFY